MTRNTTIYKKAGVVIFALCAVCVFITPAMAETTEVKVSSGTAAAKQKASVEDEMRGVKITEARMVQMPHFGFILPNSEIQLSVHQQISSTTFDVESRYDMINTFFTIGFDLKYNFSRYFSGAALDDTIFFELNLGPSTYFQRTHNITPYFGYKLGRFTEVKTAVSVGNTITASVDQNVKYDKGNVLVESIGIKYNTADRLNPVPNGSMLGCKFFASHRGLGSDYEYTKAEVDIKSTYMPLKWDYLEALFQFYFPMTTVYRPISDVYYAGGYEILRGYSFREFYGDTLMYGKLNYHLPILRNLKKHAFRGALQILTIDFTAETAEIDNARNFGLYYSMKSSMSAGISCDVVMFEHINLKFNTFAGKAIESNRMPVLYFILTAYTYFSI